MVWWLKVSRVALARVVVLLSRALSVFSLFSGPVRSV